MEKIYVSRIGEIKKIQKKLEEILKVKLSIRGREISFSGEPLNEFEAKLIFEAVDFGFKINDSLKLKNEEMSFRKIHIKDYTRRNLEVVKSRLIGTKGKTRRTIEGITGCKILIRESDVGIICGAEEIENVATAIISIIRGTKQSNMYQYLEKMNRIKKLI